MQQCANKRVRICSSSLPPKESLLTHAVHVGSLYLFMKTPERAHLPAKMWEKVKLSTDYAKALEQIDTELQYWPSFLKHKCKQRTTKIVQYLIKMRKLRTRETGKLVPVKKKLERREAARESKALAAAKLEKNLEKELVARLKSRAYGDMPLNVNEDVWRAVLEKERLDAEKEGEEALELEEDDDDLDEEDDVSDSDDDDDDDASSRRKGKRRAVERKAAPPTKKPRRGPRVEIEYEMEGPARDQVYA